jgi:hypothetical protein
MTDAINELSEPLRTSLQHMRDASVNDESVSDALLRAKHLAGRPTPSRWRKVGRAVVDVLAASVMLGIGLAYPLSRIDLSVKRAGFSIAGLGFLEMVILVTVVAVVGVFVNRHSQSRQALSQQRRWLQITLRTIVLVVIVCGVLFAGAATHYRNFQIQNSASQRIAEQGWLVTELGKGDWLVDCEKNSVNDADLAALVEHLPALPHVRLKLSGSRVTDEGLSHLRDLDNLFLVDLSATDIGDAGLSHLTSSALRSLDLSSTRITDAGLRHLRTHDLESLVLNNTQITDQGLVQLTESASLSSLGLSGTKVTDVGVRRLARLRGLRHLDLSSTQITGAVFQYFSDSSLTMLNLDGAGITDDTLLKIARMKSLIEVHVRRTAVTDEGVRQLHERSPHIHVFR